MDSPVDQVKMGFLEDQVQPEQQEILVQSVQQGPKEGLVDLDRMAVQGPVVTQEQLVNLVCCLLWPRL